MSRYLGWLANTVLFVVCCALVADTANAIIRSWISRPPQAQGAPTVAAQPVRGSASDTRVIVSRNLFHSAALAPAVLEEPEVPEELEETRLPLKLKGTVASENVALAWAVVEDLDARDTVVLRVDDRIKTATVLGIERRRIVLSENGTPRELSLEDEEGVSPKSALRDRVRRRTSRTSSNDAAAARRRAADARREREERRAQVPTPNLTRDGEGRFSVDRDEVQAMMRNPAALLSQARIMPHYDEESGQMLGLSVSSIKPGSVFEEIGMADGEVITEVNGVPIDSAEQSTQILTSLAEQTELSFTVMDESGNTRPLNFTMP